MRRHGKQLQDHQRWMLKAAVIVGNIMVVMVILVEAYSFLDEHLDISTTLGLTTEASELGSRRLNSKPLVYSVSKPGWKEARKDGDEDGFFEGFYPKDYTIGRWTDNDPKKKDWKEGTYGNAPVGNKFGIILHIIGTVYMLIGLNTVCDVYFCGALDEMVEKWQVQPDVAGATFMAAGGSAPELFTSIIGACGVESDVGFGTIVGSAVFNVLAVIGCCGMVAQQPIALSWWPLFRDCSFYIFGLLVLALCAGGPTVENPCSRDGKYICQDASICGEVGKLLYLGQKAGTSGSDWKDIVSKGIPGATCIGGDFNSTHGKNDWKTGDDVRKEGGGKIVLAEAIILFSLYFVYILIMYFNEPLEKFVGGLLGKQKKVAPIEDETEEKDGLRAAGQSDAAPGPPEHHKGVSQGEKPAPDSQPPTIKVDEVEQIGNAAKDAQTEGDKPKEVATNGTASMTSSANNDNQKKDKTPGISKHDMQRMHHKAHVAHSHHHNVHHRSSSKERCSPPAPETAQDPQDSKVEVVQVIEKGAVADEKKLEEGTAGKDDKEGAETGKKEDQEDGLSKKTSESEMSDVEALMTKPEDPKELVQWVLCLPVYAPLYYGIPRPTPKMCVATFAVALLWIAGFSYFLVYFVTMFGDAILGGGNSVTVVMGFTLLAAGTSIPDLVSSMSVARAGEGDMAVSSSIGSNIFDILVGLPFPWILKIAIVDNAKSGEAKDKIQCMNCVAIKSPYIALYVLLLLFMVALVIGSIMFNKWYLNKVLGYMMGGFYMLFLAIVLPIELVNKGPYVDINVW